MPEVIDRPVEPPETVLVWMGRKDRIEAYSVGRKSGTDRYRSPVS